MALSLILALAMAQEPTVGELVDKHVVAVGIHDTRDAARKAAKPGATVIDSDDFSGLEPGRFLVLDSAHDSHDDAEDRCDVLLMGGTPCTLWSLGKKIGEVPSVTRASAIALEKAPDGAVVDFAGSIDSRGRSFPVVVVSYPVDGLLHETLGPLDKDFGTALFVFLTETPVEAENEFLRPGNETWIDVSCEKPKLYPLGEEIKTPLALAQHCMVGESSRYRYSVFDSTILASPLSGEAIWSNTGSALDRHEYFVPGDDVLPKSAAKERGDGRTLLAGTEAGRDPKNDELIWVREFRGHWREGRLGYRYSIWEKLDETKAVPRWWERTDVGHAALTRSSQSPSK